MRTDRWWACLLILIVGIGVMSPGFGAAAPDGIDLDEGLDVLGRQLIESVPRGASRTVAVADFRDSEGGVNGLGRQVARELVTRLSASGRVQVVVSEEVERLVDELKLNQTDLFDPATTPKMGKMVGADMILAGTVTDMGALIRINGQLIDTELRRVLGAGAVSVAKDDHVRRLLDLRIGGESRPVEQPAGAVQRNIPEVEVPQIRYPVFENDFVKVTVRSVQRLRSRIVLEIWYENLLDDPATLASARWGTAYATDHPGTYLVADTGEKWMYKEDNQIGSHYGGIELIPRQRLMNRITFVAEDRGTGSTFTYVGDYQLRWKEGPRRRGRSETFKVILQDLALMTGSAPTVSPDVVIQGDPSRGRRIYEKNCYACHGMSGDGKGPAANMGLNPRPSDLRRGRISREEAALIIKQGIPRTSMISFGEVLNEQEMGDLVEYLWSFRRR